MTIKEIRSRHGLSFRVISGEHDEVKRALSEPTSEDIQGPVALMLCESILHLLVERGFITKATAIEAIETLGDATRVGVHIGQVAGLQRSLMVGEYVSLLRTAALLE